MAEDISKQTALSGILAAAPRHGLNAKALLLQAAALAAQEAESLESGAPKAVSEREQQVEKLKAAFVGCSKLLSGIPKKESPIVAFVNTAKIPRALRQQVLQKLAAQHLVVTLLEAGTELSPAEVAARPDARKAALSAAVEQELQLFKLCQSKASYQNLAARTDASLIRYPPEAALVRASVKQPAAPVASASIASAEDGMERMQAVPHSAAPSHDSVPNKRQKLDRAGQATQDVLVDHDIDWSQAEQMQPTIEATAAEPMMQPDVHETASKTTAQASGSSKAQSSDSQPVAPDDRPPDKPRDVKHVTDYNRVQHAVNGYIRAFLDPFYKAGIVTREMYKLVMTKSVAKVMQSHASEEDADFLLQESDQIQKLVREYIRYAQKKLNA